MQALVLGSLACILCTSVLGCRFYANLTSLSCVMHNVVVAKQGQHASNATSSAAGNRRRWTYMCAGCHVRDLLRKVGVARVWKTAVRDLKFSVYRVRAA